VNAELGSVIPFAGINDKRRRGGMAWDCGHRRHAERSRRGL